jgi:hypothetical protein
VVWVGVRDDDGGDVAQPVAGLLDDAADGSYGLLPADVDQGQAVLSLDEERVLATCPASGDAGDAGASVLTRCSRRTRPG